MNDHILSVSALTGAIKQNLEGTFQFIWIRGQIANLSRPSSGHVYFSLRDEDSSLAAVWFKGNQKAGEKFDPLTGEVYEDGPRSCIAPQLENGQEIICAGRIAVYAPRGVYQLVVEIAQEAGHGRLHEEFALLRARLDSLGYFSLERKRPLPENPVKIAIVTAPGGAAIHDFIRIAETRGLGARVRILPVQVQGLTAAPAIVAAMQRITDEAWADVIVLIRGGGSIEDLWAFNDERLATAIYLSPLPVLAGIGHEVDFTLADMTADVRAATPSHAAQLLWPERNEIERRFLALQSAFKQATTRSILRQDERLTTLSRELEWRSPERKLDYWNEKLESCMRFLINAGKRICELEMARLISLRTSLEESPKKLPPLAATLAMSIQRMHVALLRSIEHREKSLERLTENLVRSPIPQLRNKAHLLEKNLVYLEALNPYAPLERGYALAKKQDGTFVRMTKDVVPGEKLSLAVRDGEIDVQVQARQPNQQLLTDRREQADS